MNSRYRRGWFNESHRHYLAAKGISTNHYLSRFNKHYVDSSARFIFKNPEGQKIIYSPELSTEISVSGELRGPSPDDVAYVLDESVPELTPADVMLLSREESALLSTINSFNARSGEFEHCATEQELLKSMNDKRRLIQRISNDQKHSFEWKEDKIKTLKGQIEFDKLRLRLGVADDFEAAEGMQRDLSREVSYGASGLYRYSGDGDVIEVLPSSDDTTSVITHEQAHAFAEDSPDYLASDFAERFPHSPTTYGGSDEDENFAESVRVAKAANDGRSWHPIIKLGSAETAKDLQAREKWFEQNVPQWNAPTARERSEEVQRPAVLEAEAKLEHARETGKYLARKRL